MAVVVFYEKPGCINNTKQKHWLRESGHELVEKNLLTHDWQTLELRQFFAELPITQWFNPSAPRIKSGEINPAQLDAEQAIALLQAEPLLIRRPLMQVGESRMVGFDQQAVDCWIGLSRQEHTANLEVCARNGNGTMRPEGK